MSMVRGCEGMRMEENEEDSFFKISTFLPGQHDAGQVALGLDLG